MIWTIPHYFQVEKTVWDWELMNDIKPIWQRPAKEVEEDEYKAFYKTFSRVSQPVLYTQRINSYDPCGFLDQFKWNHFHFQDSDEPMSHIHFTAEGEVTFKSILFIPASAPRGLFDEYGTKKNDFIKVILIIIKWEKNTFSYVVFLSY